MPPESQRYPLFSLANSIPTAEAVRDAGGLNAAVPKSSIAHGLKCSETSGAFLQRLASARSYGLIEGRGSYTLTEAARHYFFPSASGEKERALLSFAAAPPSFAALIKRLDGNKLPPRPMIANILHRELEVAESWKDRVAGFFIAAVTQVGALDSAGYLRYGATHHAMPASTTFPTMGTEAPQSTSPQAHSNYLPIRDTRESELAQGEGFDVWDYSLRGKTVILKTPKDIPLALWEKLVSYLQVIKPEPEEDGS